MSETEHLKGKGKLLNLSLKEFKETKDYKDNLDRFDDYDDWFYDSDKEYHWIRSIDKMARVYDVKNMEDEDIFKLNMINESEFEFEFKFYNGVLSLTECLIDKF